MKHYWTKFEGNPILGGERLGTCFDVNVVRDGPAPWTMYFSWRPQPSSMYGSVWLFVPHVL